jgi:hypothetical protein
MFFNFPFCNQRAQKASLPGAAGIRDVFVATKTQTHTLAE